MPANAIPTRYGNTLYRSRLECRWAALFDSLNWRFDYEGLAFASRIPDFLLSWVFPTIVEAKPANSIHELDAYRADMIRTAADWLCIDVQAELERLDALPDSSASQLAAIDQCIEFLECVRDRGENSMRILGRRALVVGGQLFPPTDITRGSDALTIDGTHMFGTCLGCNDMAIGLFDMFGCIVCGNKDTMPTPVESSEMFLLWRAAGDKTRWEPATEAK